MVISIKHRCSLFGIIGGGGETSWKSVVNDWFKANAMNKSIRVRPIRDKA